LGPKDDFWAQFAPFNSSFCFIQLCAFCSGTPNFHATAWLLVSSTCLIAIKLKLALSLQHIDFGI
jgi:hypothetical protein